jgi:predicted amidophosphoribosyltransferase
VSRCALCAAVQRSDDGVCDSCAIRLAETVRMVPVRSAPPADDRTAYVERYRPPVPPVRLS